MKKILVRIKIIIVVTILASLSIIRIVALDINPYDDLDTFFTSEISTEFEIASKAVEAINRTEKQIKLENIFKDYDEVYAGAWLDEEYTPHIAFTERNSDIEKITKNHGVVLMLHDFSERDLLDVQNELSRLIHAKMDANNSDTFIYNQISYITELNRIEVELVQSKYQESLNSITALLAEENSDSLLNYIVFEKIIVGGEYNELVAVKGGTKISAYYSTCSAGYRAYYNGRSGFVTAGHCGYQGSSVYKGLFTRVGTMEIHRYSTSMDAAWIELSGSHTAPNQTYNNRTYGSIGSSSGMGFMPGVPLVMYGLDNNDSCTLQATSVTFDGYTNLARSNCPNRKVVEGWSGGIVLNTRTVGLHYVWNANGIVVASNSQFPERIYTRKSDSIKSSLGLD